MTINDAIHVLSLLTSKCITLCINPPDFEDNLAEVNEAAYNWLTGKSSINLKHLRAHNTPIPSGISTVLPKTLVTLDLSAVLDLLTVSVP